MNTHDPDRDRGLYPKYRLYKQASSETGTWPRPVDGEFFALRETDPFAPTALRAYADSCQEGYPKLADDLREMATRWASKWEVKG